jgi:uncharacterized membrane protein
LQHATISFSHFKHELSPKKGFWLWVAAFLFAWIAIGTGPDGDARGNTNIFHFHENLADLTTILAFFVVAVRLFFIVKGKKFLKKSLIAYSILSLICAIGILSVGYFGGKMVYDQGVGVKINGQYVNPPVGK